MFQYSFSNVDLHLVLPGVHTGFKVEGFKAGEDLITIARKAPIATTDFSAYGDMVVSMQRNKSTDLVFPLLQNSRENKWLNEWANNFQAMADADGGLVNPIQAYLYDNMGEDEAQLTNGVILAIPAMSRGLTISTVTWVVSFEKGVITREGGGEIIGEGTGTLANPN